jgi:hypothetical protein
VRDAARTIGAMSPHRVDICALACAFGLAAPSNAPVVTPAQPAPTQAVTVSIKAPVNVGDGTRWYEVEVTAPSRSSACEFYEMADATTARKGRRVQLILRPVDKGRWCPGEYTGTLTLQKRVRCDDRIDEDICTTERRLAAVRFTVT